MHPADNSDASSARPNTAPGWYPDPSGAPLQRYWDGISWTAQTAGPHTAPVPAQDDAGRKRLTWAIAIACGILLVALLVLWSMRPGREGQPGQPGQSSNAAMVYSPAPDAAQLELSPR